MITKDLGAVTAYAEAVEAGYTGTEEEYAALLASYATVAQNAAASASAAAQSATDAAGSATSAAASATEASTTVSEAIANIEAAGDAQVDLVTAEGTTQIGLVSAEGASQVSAVDAKGAEVIESIPEDYTELSADVTQLKSDLSTVYDYKTLTKLNETAHVYEYTFIIGNTYFIKNITSGISVNLRTCTSDGTEVEVIKNGIAYGEVALFTPTKDASYVRLYSLGSTVNVQIGQYGAVLDSLQDEIDTNKNALELQVTALSSDAYKKSKYMSKGLYPYELPSGFNGNSPVTIYTDGYHYQTDYNADKFKNTGGRVLYVSPTPSANPDGSRKKPYAFKGAYNAASSGDTIVLTEGLYTRDIHEFSPIKKSINVIGEGNVKIFQGSFINFTKESGYDHVYKGTRNSGVKVFDFSAIEGGYVSYMPVSSIADVEATKGSFYRDDTANYYVHPLSETNPTGNVGVSVNTPAEVPLSVDNADANVNAYFSNMTLIGLPRGITVDKGSSENTLTAIYDNIYMVYCGGPSYNALAVYGGDVVLHEVTIDGSFRDGFNYNGTDTRGNTLRTTNIMEIDCIAHDCGILQDNDSQNGSTAHKNAKVIRINGIYYDNKGANCADVQTDTQSVNLGCTAYASKSAQTGYSQNFAAQQAGATMWCENCVGDGSNTDFLCATGATMTLSQCTYTTKSGDITDTDPVGIDEWLIRNKVQVI